MSAVAAVDPYAFAVDEDAYLSGDHAWLDELDQVAVHAGEPHQRMGMRAVAEPEWLVADGHRAGELALRRRIFDGATGEVFAALPGSDAACAEAAAVLHGWLGAHRPEWLAAWDPDRAHPLERAALAVQDDLCVMERDDDGWRLTAAVVCFPSYWRLADKMGRPQEAVHGPVPHYADDLADKVSRFFDRLAPDRFITRRDWGFVAHPLLFVPSHDRLRQPSDFDLDHLWMRSERQTLRRLPDSGAVLFTIRTQLAPASAVGQRPAVAARLLDAITHWTPELAASRGGRHGWLPAVVAWLTGAAAT